MPRDIIDHYAHIWWDMTLIFDLVQDRDPNDIYTKYRWHPMKTVHVIVGTTNGYELARELMGKLRKNISFGIRQNQILISGNLLRALNIPYLKALTHKLTPEMQKMHHMIRYKSRLIEISVGKWFVYTGMLYLHQLKNRKFSSSEVSH